MQNRNTISVGVLLCALSLCQTGVRADSRSSTTSVPVIAVTDFRGRSSSTGKFIADTLVTDLDQSTGMRLLDRSLVERTYREFQKTVSTSQDPNLMQHIGQMVSADRLIEGRYLLQDGTLFLNAQMLDVHTGLIQRGAAFMVAGPAANLPQLIQQIAQKLNLAVTGEVLSGNSASTQTIPEAISPASSSSLLPINIPNPMIADNPITLPTIHPDYADGQGENGSGRASYLSNLVMGRGNETVTEEDMARITRAISQNGEGIFTVQHPGEVVTRVRALVGLMRAVLPLSRRALLAEASEVVMPTPDTSSVPFWALPYLQVAVSRSFFPSDRNLAPFHPATWTFVKRFLERWSGTPIGSGQGETGISPQAMQVPIPPVIIPPAAVQPAPPAPYTGPITGLVLDVRGLGANRYMSLQVVDQQGNLVYPRPSHMPSPDYVEQNGTAHYVHHVGAATHVGEHPLVVHAISAHNDVVMISDADAQRILAANQSDHFLWFWHVCMVMDPGH